MTKDLSIKFTVFFLIKKIVCSLLPFLNLPNVEIGGLTKFGSLKLGD